MPVTGQGRLGVLVVAEAPGESEDRQNIQLIGQAGQVLRDSLHGFGIDLDKDCRKTNAVRCRPPGNRKPTPMEIASCQSHIWEEIKAHPPKVILLLGQSALESFLLNRVKSPGPIGRWRGFVIPDQKAKAWVCASYHPSYVLRCKEGWVANGRTGPSTSVEENAFTSDLENALGYIRKPFSVAPIPEIKLHNYPEVASYSKVEISIDYETTGLRPWKNKDHKIICCAFGWETGASAFPVSIESVDYLKAVLSDKSIYKIGHNIKFEHQWASHCLGVETQGWIWDSMLAAHMVDNRKHICGLKHQVYLNFGVESWGDDFEFGEDSIQAITDSLLRYNALDAWWTFNLAKKQMGLFKQ
jgi:uracil-DNA glycosylase family 4